MAKNTMDDLRDHLFACIEMVKTGELKPDAAKAVEGLGRTLIETAKVELRAMELTGAARSQSRLLGPVMEAPRPALPEPVITYKCRTRLCEWEGRQKEKEMVRDGEHERRVCPACKKDHFFRLVNGVQEPIED